MSEVHEILMSEPQFRLVSSPSKYPAFVGGLGSGKTEALLNRCLRLKFSYPTCNDAYYLPTYDLVRMIAFPRFEEKLENLKMYSNAISYKSVKSPRPSILLQNNGEPAGEIIFRTMDNPSLIVGYEVADSFIDELDVLKTEDAKKAWQRIIARNRQKKPDGRKNTVAVGTTPEGYKYVYDRWKKDPQPGFELIRASTRSNQHNLPYGYVDELIAQYPTNLVQAYIEGEFVNLTSGSVYPDFDRKLNGCNTQIIGPAKQGEKGELLHIGMDFNVTKMAAIIHVKRDNEPHVVDELTNIFDTPAMIRAIKQRWANHPIAVYPDASGGSRKSVEASESDISLLRNAGFAVYSNNSNPAVKDRVLSVNVMISNAEGKRRLKVNVNNCPVLVQGLEQQIYDKFGEPDKSTGLDHTLDAHGYFMAFTYPVRSHAVRRVQMVGI